MEIEDRTKAIERLNELNVRVASENFSPQVLASVRDEHRRLHNELKPTKPSKRNVVYYSHATHPTNDLLNKINWWRLFISIESLRTYNSDIELIVCADQIPDSELRDRRYKVNWIETKPIDRNLPSWWFVHRWLNLVHLKEDANVLYLDSDTFFADDVALLFETYSECDVYGREELGFRHCPNMRSTSADPRFLLEVVDSTFLVEGCKPVFKLCLGVLLLNNSVHMQIWSQLDYLLGTLQRLDRNQLVYPLANWRIVEEYAFWLTLGKMDLGVGLFGIQDVTHHFLERKHAERLTAVVLHYMSANWPQFLAWHSARLKKSASAP